jgi:hypothetical protein
MKLEPDTEPIEIRLNLKEHEYSIVPETENIVTIYITPLEPEPKQEEQKPWA